MKQRSPSCPMLALFVALVPALLAGVLSRATAQPGSADLEPRVPAGKCKAPSVPLLYLEGSIQGWKALGSEEDLHSRDLLLALPGFFAEVEPRPHSVTLTLWGNVPDLSDVPVLESAVVLHDSRAFDLDFTLARGRVALVNHKEKGPAHVWVRLRHAGWRLTLPEPGDEVALEVYGRWPRGVPYSRTPRPGDGPTSAVALYVLKGQIDLETGKQRLALRAPPGPAYFQWDSVVGEEAGPQRRDRPPEWSESSPAAAVKGLSRVAESLRPLLKEQGPNSALLSLLTQKAPAEDKEQAARTQEFAVLGLAALGDLVHVGEALADPEHAPARSAAIVALRHWIGAGPGRDEEFFQVLTEALRYTPAQAEAVLQLLHSPFAADVPETYETLIAYLGHDKLAVRALARWHLERLVPAGRDIGYDPAAPEAERARAVAAWKRLIPSGQVPRK